MRRPSFGPRRAFWRDSLENAADTAHQPPSPSLQDCFERGHIDAFFLELPDVGKPTQLLIAHDGSAESTKALHLGLQLASALKTGVTLVTACPREQADAAAKILQAAQALAQVRGLAAHDLLE